MKRIGIIVGLILVQLLALPIIAAAQTMIDLPYRFENADAYGNTWMIYPAGQLLQQGNMPFSGDMAGITVAGQPITQAVQAGPRRG